MATRKSREIDPNALAEMSKMDEMFRAANNRYTQSDVTPHPKGDNKESETKESRQAEKASIESSNKNTTPKAEKKEKQSQERKPATTTEPTQERRLGRPRARTFSKDDSSRLFIVLPNDLKEKLQSCAFYSKTEQSEIVRTALWYFFNKFADNSGALLKGGVMQIEKYVNETTIK